MNSETYLVDKKIRKMTKKKKKKKEKKEREKKKLRYPDNATTKMASL